MISRLEKIDKVILFHDINRFSRTGMQKSNSRYLLDWKKFQQIFESKFDTDFGFETIVNNPQSNSPKSKTRITIDDGGGSCIEIAKFLKNKNVKGYFFIVTDFIGKPNFLNANEIKEIFNMGHEIGSHSHTHPHPFHFLNYDEIIYEIKKSKTILESILQTPIKRFSVPGGEVNKRILRTLSDPILDLDEIYISTPFKGVMNFKFSNKIKIFGRLCIEAGMSDSSIQRYLLGKGWLFALVDYQVKRLKREIIYKLKC